MGMVVMVGQVGWWAHRVREEVNGLGGVGWARRGMGGAGYSGAGRQCARGAGMREAAVRARSWVSVASRRPGGAAPARPAHFCATKVDSCGARASNLKPS